MKSEIARIGKDTSILSGRLTAVVRMKLVVPQTKEWAVDTFVFLFRPLHVQAFDEHDDGATMLTKCRKPDAISSSNHPQLALDSELE